VEGKRVRVQERVAGDGRFLSYSLVGKSYLQSVRLFAFSRRSGRFAEVARDQTVAAFVCKVGNGLQSLALVAIGCVAIPNQKKETSGGFGGVGDPRRAVSTRRAVTRAQQEAREE
jgi:hypothetical protein